MDLGKRIRFYREQISLSQKELSKLIYISERSVGHYETGKRIPPVDKLILIAHTLNVDLSDLLETKKKTEKEWAHFMIYHPDPNKRKNMDENLFRLFLKRMGFVTTIKEDDTWIKSSELFYPKRLGNLLLGISNKYITFTGIFYEKSGLWTIIGYIGNNSFKIGIVEEEEFVRFHSSAPFYENKHLSFEFKQIINSIIIWYSKEYPNRKIKYDIETLLYTENTNKDDLLDLELESFHFIKNDYSSFSGFRHIKESGYDTLRKIFKLKKEKDFTNNSEITNFLSNTNELLTKVTSFINEYPLHSVASLPTKSSLKKRYPNSNDIPINQIDLDIKTALPFHHRGHQTLGEIADFTKEDVDMIYAIHGISNKTNELEEILFSYNLKFNS